MWNPRRLITLQVSMACYKVSLISFTFVKDALAVFIDLLPASADSLVTNQTDLITWTKLQTADMCPVTKTRCGNDEGPSAYILQPGNDYIITRWHCSCSRHNQVMPWLRRLVADFPSRCPGFDPRTYHVRSVVDRAARGQVCSEYFGFHCHSFIPLTAP
jgi:hypothetical protein